MIRRQDIDFEAAGFTFDRKGQFKVSPAPGSVVQVVSSKRRGLFLARKLAEIGLPHDTFFDPAHPYHVLLEWRLPDSDQVDRCLKLLASAKVLPAPLKPDIA